MSRYRSEEDALKARIAELFDDLQAARDERDRILGVLNQGPLANQMFSRGMYALGRAIGRFFGKRTSQTQANADELRKTARDLETRVAEMRAAVEEARQEKEAEEARKAAPMTDD